MNWIRRRNRAILAMALNHIKITKLEFEAMQHFNAIDGRSLLEAGQAAITMMEISTKVESLKNRMDRAWSWLYAAQQHITIPGDPLVRKSRAELATSIIIQRQIDLNAEVGQIPRQWTVSPADAHQSFRDHLAMLDKRSDSLMVRSFKAIVLLAAAEKTVNGSSDWENIFTGGSINEPSPTT